MNVTQGENIDFSSDKYEKANPITKALLNNFFKTVLGLIPKDTRNVLEVGCGGGFSTERLRGGLANKHFEASDHDSELVSSAKERNPDMKISKESIYSLTRSSNSFDVVISLEVFEHLEDTGSAFKEIIRVSSRYAILSVPNEPTWRILNMLRGKYIKDLGNTPGHINHWTPRGFETFVGEHMKVISRKNPMPWTAILAEKR